MVEVLIVVVIVGVLSSVAVPGFNMLQEDQGLKSAAREIADSMMLARAQAIRTGNNVIVIFQGASGTQAPMQLRTTNAIDVVNDGVAASADCTIAQGELEFSIPAADGLSWGTTASLAGNNVVASDPGFAPSNASLGSTFTDATVSSTTMTQSKFTSWVVFQPDGIPRLMTPGDCASLGAPSQGGGGIYLTNGRRDYAVVLSSLGMVRVHNWGAGTGWSQ